MSRSRARSRHATGPTYGLQPHQLAHPLVVVEERRDPDAPPRWGMIRGPRRIGMHDRLATEGLLSRAACAAGTKYARIAEMVRLGLTQDPDAVRAGTAPHRRVSAAEVYVAALEDLARANGVLGPHGQRIVELVVCEGQDALETYRRIWPGAKPVHQQIARNRIAGALSGHLERLAELWVPAETHD